MSLAAALLATVATSTASLSPLERELYRELRLTVRRAETAEARLSRTQAALEDCDTARVAPPDWVWPVLGVAAGVASAAVVVLVVEAGR